MPLSGLVPIQSSHQQRMRQVAHLNSMRQHSHQVNKSREVWIDGGPGERRGTTVKSEGKPPLSQPRPTTTNNNTKYGYMDEHKANMINSWVEHQSSPEMLPQECATELQVHHEEQPVFRALTQFKTIDSDESSESAGANGAEGNNVVSVSGMVANSILLC